MAAASQFRHPAQRIGLVLGPVLAVGLQLLPRPEALEPQAWLVLSLMVLMAIWWATEAIPIAVTALMPLVVLPLAGLPLSEVTAPYASSIVLLLLGGFIMATAIERHNLHKRLALNVVAAAPAGPAALVAGFMAAAALMSMWISNTATTLMLAPIAASAARAMEGESHGRLSAALMLGLAYAASVGGLATPVGTPTNLIIMGQLEEATGEAIAFVEWMTLGLPVVAVLLPVLWFVLTQIILPVRGVTAGGAGRDEARRSLSELGAWSTPELRVAGVFAVVALAWITRPFLQQIPGLSGLSDMGIAVMGAVAMFLVPAQKDQGMLLDWEHARRLPWRVVILFGGGLSLAAGISQSGLAGWAGEQLAGLGVMPWFVMALVVTVLVIFATEIMSNVATISAAAPVLIALGTAAGIDPVVIAAPAAMAASCAFMLPVATGPNAIVYAGGRVSMGQMIRAGFALNIIAALIVAFLAGWLGRVVFGG